MAERAGGQDFSLFTYGLGLTMGLPVASFVSDVVTSEPNWMVILGFTIVLGSLGAAGGYLIDRWREQRSGSDG